MATPMYTKMTATGSSLIAAPRTISKELEAKIAAAIAGVIARHDMSKMTTKLIREAVEKEVKVSLTNHREVLKRILHQEVRRVKADRAAKRAPPPPWKHGARRRSAHRGLARVFALARDAAVSPLGMQAMRGLFDLQRVERGDLARLARTYMRALGAQWVQANHTAASRLPWSSLPSVPSPAEVTELLQGIYTVERVGIAHPQRVELLEFLDRTPPVHSTEGYLGWDPAVAPPASPQNGQSPSVYRQMANALLLCWYAHALQTTLGCTFVQLIQHLPALYPYRGPAELSSDEYRDQVHLVTTLVLVLSGFGALRCEPDLLPHEYYFLRQHLVFHIVRQDVALVAEIMRALRCFDGADSLLSVRRGMAMLMLSQGSDGSWEPDTSSYRESTCTAGMNAVFALCEPQPMGFAPSIVEIVPLLEMHVNAELPLVMVEDEKDAKKPAAVESTAGPAGPTDPSPSDTAAPIVAPPGEEDLETQVRFLQGMLEKDGGNVKNVSAALAGHVVSTLTGMALSVEILKNTGIGRVINKLRKHSDEGVAKAAGDLVAQWKKTLL